MAEARMLVANRYQLRERLAAGGIAEAWRASDLLLGRPVAVRLLRSGHTACVKRFLAGARSIAQVFHPGIVRVHDYGRSGAEGIPFLVTEPVSASSLAAVMRAGPLDPAWVLEVICQVTSALEVAHAAGLVHQAITSRNLVLAPGGAVKLTDFGLPDAGGPSVVTPAGDLYCVGVVAWECLTGRPPPSAVPPEVTPGREIRPLPPLPAGVPAEVAALVADLTAADPEARPASAAEVAARSTELLAVPMRAAEPRQSDCPGATLLLDPPTRRSRQVAGSLVSPGSKRMSTTLEF
jgi:eukaryotic-like serine/threonine-protein kinase